MVIDHQDADLGYGRIIRIEGMPDAALDTASDVLDSLEEEIDRFGRCRGRRCAAGRRLRRSRVDEVAKQG
jgi:hypothetical protein